MKPVRFRPAGIRPIRSHNISDIHKFELPALLSDAQQLWSLSLTLSLTLS